MSLASCHPVCDTQSYTVINTQLSAKKKHFVGREPTGGGAAIGHSALGTGSLHTARMEAHPLSSAASFELSGLENCHLLPWTACARGCICCVLGLNHPAGGVVHGSACSTLTGESTSPHLPLLAAAVLEPALLLDNRQVCLQAPGHFLYRNDHPSN